MNNLGVLPYGWRVDKLGNLLEKIVGGGTPSREKEKFWNGEIPWATVKDLRKTILHSTEESITNEAVKESASNLIPKNTLIIATRMALGKVALFTQEVAINQDLKALFPTKELTRQFLFHWLQGHAEEIERLGSGSTVKGIRLEVLKGLDLLLPPLPEQQKIAEILSTVDEKIAVIDEQLAKTTELKTGLMQRLLTKGIGHTTFKDSPLGEIPESWEVVRGEDISNLISKGSSPGWQGFDYTTEGLLFVTSENVKDGRLDLSNPKFLPVAFNKVVAKSQLQNGDILINIVGASIGRTCLYESQYALANINQAVCVLRPNSRILGHYILYFLQSPDIIKKLLGTQAGSARQNLSLADIRGFTFKLPPLTEQHQIAELLSTVDEKIQVLRDKKEHYHALKRGLMQQLLTGNLRVRVTEDAVPA